MTSGPIAMSVTHATHHSAAHHSGFHHSAAHHSRFHHTATHHSAMIREEVVLIAAFLFTSLGAAWQSPLVLLLHRTAWSGLGNGTLLGAGSLGTRSLGDRS